MSLTVHRDFEDNGLWHVVDHDIQESIFKGSHAECMERMGLDPVLYPNPDQFKFQMDNPNPKIPVLMDSGMVYLGSRSSMFYYLDTEDCAMVAIDIHGESRYADANDILHSFGDVLSSSKNGDYVVFKRSICFPVQESAVSA